MALDSLTVVDKPKIVALGRGRRLSSEKGEGMELIDSVIGIELTRCL